MSKYLKMAFTESIAVKSKEGIIELTPNKEIRVNPSPSNDPWFDDPRNVDELNRRIDELKSGKATLTPYSAEEFKRRFGL